VDEPFLSVESAFQENGVQMGISPPGLALMQKRGLTLDMHEYIDRAMTVHLKTDLKIFPAVALIGPRQCG
jgi:hypothetical protein